MKPTGAAGPANPAEFFGSMTTLIARTTENKQALSSQVFVKAGKDGQVLFHRVPEKNASDKIMKLYMASPKAQQARELAGQKIRTALEKSGVQITDSIRKALPSKVNAGDFNKLQGAFTEAKLKLDNANSVAATKLKPKPSEQQVLSAVKSELAALDWNNPACVGTLFRDASGKSQSLITDFLAGTFTKSIENCVSNAVQTSMEVLHQTKSPDDMLVALNTATLKELGNVRFTPEFNQLAFSMLDLADQVAREKLAEGGGKFNAAVVDPIRTQVKEKLFGTIFLRTLTLDLAQSLRKVENQLKDAVEKTTGKVADRGFKPATVAALTQGLFSGAKDIGKRVGVGTGIKEDMPHYHDFALDTDKNNLNGFTALNELKKAAGLI